MNSHSYNGFGKRQKRRKDVILGIGDDCAAINVSSDRMCLITTDMLVDGTHLILKNAPFRMWEGKPLHAVSAMWQRWDARLRLQ